MKRVLLFTEDNQRVEDCLKKKLHLECVSLSYNDKYEYFLKQKKLETGVIIEINESNFDLIEEILQNCHKFECKIIAVADEMTCNIKKFLIENGISRYLNLVDLFADPFILSLSNDNYFSQTEKIILCEDNEYNIKIISDICNYYNYEYEILNSCSEIISKVKQQNCILLVNLGTQNFDINSFISKSLSTSQMKNTPFIPYKNNSSEICVEEIYSGLHRYARAILSPDELFSFLTNTLFRKELYYLSNMLEQGVELKNNMFFVENSLTQLYYSLGSDIFTLKNISSGSNLKQYGNVITQFRNNLAKINLLKWLIIDNEQESTCGYSIQNLV